MLFVSHDWLKIVMKLKAHSNINRFKVLSQGKERKKKKKDNTHYDREVNGIILFLYY